MTPGFVYAIQPEGMDLVKIGHTSDPAGRAQVIASFSPVPMVFRHLLQVSSHDVSKVFEAMVLGLTQNVASHGEWRRDLDFVDDCFGCIAPAVDRLGDFQITKKLPRWKNPIDLAHFERLAVVTEAVVVAEEALADEHGWQARRIAREMFGVSSVPNSPSMAAYNMANSFLLSSGASS